MLKNNRHNLIAVLVISSLFSLLLSFVRIYISETGRFLFLIWNLFLAWIPFICSSVLLSIVNKKESSKVAIGNLLFIWFIFFPNAPYIITDLFHLRLEQTVPLWFDVALIFSYVWNGLLLGFISLLDIQLVIEKTSKKKYSWLVVCGVLILGSFGIYLGRYLRWNSWDIVQHPIMVVKDSLELFTQVQTYTFTIIFFMCLLMCYSTIHFLIAHHIGIKK